MDIREFRKDFLENVLVDAEANKEFKARSFADVFTNYLAESGIFSDYEATPFQREKQWKKKISISGYALNSFDETIVLVVSDFDGQDEAKTLTKSEAIRTFGFLRAFIEESLTGVIKEDIDISDPAYGLTAILSGMKEKIRKYKLFLITDKILSEQVTIIKSDNIGETPVELHVWDMKRLCALIEDGGDSPKIIFADYKYKDIPCVKVVNDSGYVSYLCAMPGNLLADLYDDLGSTLLEGNIRSFLSTKVAVNRDIRRTINSVDDAPKFFMFNNGISATASDVDIKEINGAYYLSSITDFQIVNGGQTTASLSNARYADKAKLEKIFVSMKLTVIEKEDAQKLIPIIAKCANTQNKVSAADFFSNHEYCQRMETFSRKLYVSATDGSQHDLHWFFERAKGQYIKEQMRKTPTEVKKFKLQNPKDKMFSKTDLAKWRTSFDCKPHLVSKGAQTNFEQFSNAISNSFDKEKDKYNSIYFQETIAMAIMFKATEKLVTEQDWYQYGYRAQIVTYSISLFMHLMKKNYPMYTIDFNRIWKTQQMPAVFEKEFAVISKIVNDFISDESRETVNVTQWCKREACWNNMINNCDYIPNKKILDYCISKDEEKSLIASGKKDQRQDVKIKSEIWVFEYGAENWKRLYEFSLNRKIASIDQIAALKIAIQMPRRIPNAYQAKQLVELLEKALGEGYRQ